MHDKIINNPKICLELMDRSVTPIRPRDYLSSPLMVQLTLEGDIDHFENHWPKLRDIYQPAVMSLTDDFMVVKGRDVP